MSKRPRTGGPPAPALAHGDRIERVALRLSRLEAARDSKRSELQALFGQIQSIRSRLTEMESELQAMDDPSFSFLFEMRKAKMRKDQLRTWNDRYSQLLEYKDEHKNCLVPRDYSKNKALGKWVNNQRTQYRLRSEGKKSQLTEARIEDLSKAGFVWSPQGNSWDDRYSQLLEYKDEHKNCLVPQDYSKNKALGTWVGKQRTQYRLRSEGKKSQLTEARIEDLSKAGFVWSPQGNSWDDRYSQLLEYKDEHKNCLVPRDYSKNKALGTWVGKQREQYRLRSEGKHSCLTEARIEDLSEAGFVWSPQGNSWDDRYSQLLEYKDEHKNCLVPQDYSKNKALGTWVGKQRTQYRLRSEGKKSQLTEARIEDLSKAGFVWRVNGKKK